MRVAQFVGLLFVLLYTTHQTLPLAYAQARKPRLVVKSIDPTCGSNKTTLSLTGKNLTLIDAVSIRGKSVRLLRRTNKMLRFKLPSKLKGGFSQINIFSGGKRIGRRMFRVGCSQDVAFKEFSNVKTQKVIGRQGGSLEATLPSGLIYSLIVPTGALSSDTNIAITPLREIAGIPFSKGIVAAAKFEPSGLTFNVPVELRITVPKKPTGKILAFHFSGSKGYSYRALTLDDTQLRLELTGFSGGGAGAVSKSDFVLAVQSIINQTGVLSPTQINDLAEIFSSMIALFPDLCEGAAGEKLCDALRIKSEEAVTQRLAVLCPNGQASSSSSEIDADEVISLLDAAQKLALPIVNPFGCAEAIYGRVLDEAIARAISLPTQERFERIFDLNAKFQRLGLTALVIRAEQGILAAGAEVVRLVEIFCPSAVSTAMQFAQFAEVLFAEQTLTSSTLRTQLDQAYESCGSGILISPDAVRLSPLTQLRFSGQLVNLFDTNLAWNVAPFSSLDPGGTTPTIDQTGLLVAGTRGGFYKITADAISAPRIQGETIISVADILDVRVNPTFEVEVEKGRTQQFNPLVDRVGPISEGVSWSATGGTIDANGLYTAGQVTGTFQVRATSTAQPSKFGVRSVRVVEPAGVPLTTFSSCAAEVNSSETILFSVGGSVSAVGGVAPYNVSIESCAGSAVCFMSSVGFAADVTTGLVGAHSVSGTISDQAGGSVSRGITVAVSSGTLPPFGPPLLERVLAIVSGAGCDRFTVAIRQ